MDKIQTVNNEITEAPQLDQGYLVVNFDNDDNFDLSLIICKTGTENIFRSVA